MKPPGEFARMRFLLNPIGSIGDLHPYLAVGSALRDSAGTTSPSSRIRTTKSSIRGAGLGFVALGTAEDLEGFWRDPKMWRPWSGWKVSLDWSVIRPMRQAYEEIAARYVPGETVVAGPGWAFGARLAQDKLGVPMATFHLGADKFQSVYQSPRMPPPMWLPDGMPRVLKRLQYWIADTLFTDPLLAPPTNAFGPNWGCLPCAPSGPLVAFAAALIGMFPDWFGPPQPDWPPQTLLTGFPLWDRGELESVPEELAQFLAAGDRRWCSRLGRPTSIRGLLSCRGRRLPPLGPPGILITKFAETCRRICRRRAAFPYVPFATCCLARGAGAPCGDGHHGAGVAAGIPQLVTPMVFGQPQNGASWCGWASGSASATALSGADAWPASCSGF